VPISIDGFDIWKFQKKQQACWPAVLLGGVRSGAEIGLEIKTGFAKHAGLQRLMARYGLDGKGRADDMGKKAGDHTHFDILSYRVHGRQAPESTAQKAADVQVTAGIRRRLQRFEARPRSNCRHGKIGKIVQDGSNDTHNKLLSRYSKDRATFVAFDRCSHFSVDAAVQQTNCF